METSCFFVQYVSLSSNKDTSAYTEIHCFLRVELIYECIFRGNETLAEFVFRTFGLLFIKPVSARYLFHQMKCILEYFFLY